MVNSDFRRRVELLLSGDLSHLDRLFLFVRDRCDGRKTIQEIGDLIAHPNRDKGVVTESAKKYFVIMRYVLEYRKKVLDLNDLPGNFLQFLDIMFNQIEHKEVKLNIGISLRHLRSLLRDIKSKFALNDRKRFFLVSNLDNTNGYSDRPT